MALMTAASDEVRAFEPGEIPPQAAMVITALEAGDYNHHDRRAARRFPFRVATQFRLFSDGSQSRVLYTREINRKCLGFVTEHRLPLGYGGVIELPDDHGNLIEVHCTLLRCREAAPGWCEGSVYFNREQPQFDR